VIIEDRIREWEAERSSSGLFCPAAKSVAQSQPSAPAHPHEISNRELTMPRASASRSPREHLAKGPTAPWRTVRGICSPISNRELTMRRASASRASAPWRTTRGICPVFANRELELLEPSLTYRKQTKAPSSNRELSTNLCRNNSQLPLPNLPQIRKWSRPLLTGSAPQTEIGLTYRKQTTEYFLTGARTHIRESRICAKISVETNEEMSPETSENMSAETKAIR